MDNGSQARLLDVAALTEDLPTRGLSRGQVGTVVEELAPGVFEVEFSDDKGRAYASLAVRAEHLMRLRYEPAAVSTLTQSNHSRTAYTRAAHNALEGRKPINGEADRGVRCPWAVEQDLG